LNRRMTGGQGAGGDGIGLGIVCLIMTWRFRAVVGVVTLLQVLLVSESLLLSPDVGSAYLRATRLRGGAAELPLPLLTTSIVLPLLRVLPSDPHRRPFNQWWVLAVWLSALVLPLSAPFTLLGREHPQGLANYLLIQVLTFTLWSFLFVTVAGGLAMPFACL
jgi:hypothetical protein